GFTTHDLRDSRASTSRLVSCPWSRPRGPPGVSPRSWRFSGWHVPIAEIAEATDEGPILRQDVYYLEPLPRWSAGRLLLVGDAAHATAPGIGQAQRKRSRTQSC